MLDFTVTYETLDGETFTREYTASRAVCGSGIDAWNYMTHYAHNMIGDRHWKVLNISTENC